MQRKVSLFFLILILFLGSLGYFTVDLISSSIRKTLFESRKNILTADYGMSSRFQIPVETTEKFRSEILKKDTSLELIQSIELFSMIKSKEKSKLVQVKSFEKGFPFYGKITPGPGGKEIQNLNPGEVLISESLKNFLSVSLGDAIQIGDKSYTIGGFIIDDTSSGTGFSFLTEKVYIWHESLMSSGLIQFGSTITHWIYLKSTISEDNITEVFNQLKLGENIKFVTPQKQSQDSQRFIDATLDYMQITSMISLLLALVATIYLYRSYLFSLKFEVALKNVFGLTSEKSFWILTKHLFFIGAINFTLSFLVFLGLESWLQNVFASQVGLSFQMNWGLIEVLELFVFCSLMPLLFCMPLLLDIRNTPVQELLSEEARFKEAGFSIYLKWMPILFFAIFGAVFYKTSSIKLTLFFAISILALMFLIWGSFKLYSLLLQKISENNFLIYQSSLYIDRKKSQSYTLVFCLTIGLFLFAFLPQLQSNIQNQMGDPKKNPLPSLFLFDIQDTQVQQLQEFSTQNQASLKNITPMVRARIFQIKGKELPTYLEQLSQDQKQDIAPVLRRGVNITYRSHLNPSEKVIEGEFLTEALPGGVLALSLEKRFASRLSLKLGDEIGFDIQGFNVNGVVKSIRSVRWNSFEPNFFIVTHPGELESAPQTFIATYYQLEEEMKLKLQNSLTENFGNVSVIDVKILITKLLQITDSLLFAIKSVALASLVLGFVILLILLREQLSQRFMDFNLLKVIGTQSSTLRSLILVENSLLFLFCFVISGVPSSVLVVFLGDYLWNSEFEIFYIPLFQLYAGVGAIIFLSSLGFSWKISSSISKEK